MIQISNSLRSVVVIGASPNPARYSYVAVKILVKAGFNVIPIGIKDGKIDKLQILNGKPELKSVHTVSIFIRAEKQKEYYNYILNLKPDRIIFNPGAENPYFERRAKSKGIIVQKACTIEMISARVF